MCSEQDDFQYSEQDDFQSIEAIIKSEDHKSINVDTELDDARIKQERDKDITELLELYVKSFKNKVNISFWFKIIIFSVCIGILVTSFVGIFLLIYFITTNDKLNLEGIATIISALVSFLALIIGLLKIVTTYVFPQNEEENISKLVELIQINDREYAKIRKQEVYEQKELANKNK